MAGWGIIMGALPRWWTPGIIIIMVCWNTRYFETDPQEYFTNLFHDPYDNDGSKSFLDPKILTGTI